MHWIKKGAQSLAVFMIFLVICLPLYISSVHAASLNLIGITGQDNVSVTNNAGYRRVVDFTKITVDASDGNDDLNASQVQASGIPFQSCESADTNIFTCIFDSGYNSPFPRTYTFAIVLKDASLSSNLAGPFSATIAIDEKAPTINSVSITQHDDNVTVEVDVSDSSCDACTNMPCSGITRIDIFRDDGKVKTVDYTDTKGKDFSATGSCPGVDPAEIELTKDEAGNDGNHSFYVKVRDWVENIAGPSATVDVVLDFTAPVVTGPLVLKDSANNILDFVSQSASGITAEVTIKDEHLSGASVTADLSDLVEIPAYKSSYKNLPATCEKTSSDTYTCRWTGLSVVISATTTVTATITGEDDYGNEFEGEAIAVLGIDTTKPTVTSIKASSEHMFGGESYIVPSDNYTIMALISETGSGLDNRWVYMDLSPVGGSCPIAGGGTTGICRANKCSAAGNTWTCEWYVTLSKSNPVFQQETVDLSIVSPGSKDDALNDFTGELTQTFQIDDDAPEFIMFNFTSVIGEENPTYQDRNITELLQGSGAVFHAFFKEETSVSPEDTWIDFSEIHFSDELVNYSRVLAESCEPIAEDSDIFDCKWSITELLTTNGEIVELNVSYSDYFGNNASNLTHGYCTSSSGSGVDPVPNSVFGSYCNATEGIRIFSINLSGNFTPNNFNYVVISSGGFSVTDPVGIDRRMAHLIPYEVLAQFHHPDNIPSGIEIISFVFEGTQCPDNFVDCSLFAEGDIDCSNESVQVTPTSFVKNVSLWDPTQIDDHILAVNTGDTLDPITTKIKFKANDAFCNINNVPMNCSLKIIARNIGAGTYYPEETDDLIFNVAAFSDCIEDTINDEFIEELADDVEFIAWYTELASALYGIAAMLGTICGLGNIMTQIYNLYAVYLRPIVFAIAASMHALPGTHQWANRMLCTTERYTCKLNDYTLANIRTKGGEDKKWSIDRLCNMVTCNVCSWTGNEQDEMMGGEDNFYDYATGGNWPLIGGGDNSFFGFCDRTNFQLTTPTAGQPPIATLNTQSGSLSNFWNNAGGDMCMQMYEDFRLDPFESIINSLICGCITGILYHLRNLREIDCGYLACAYSLAVAGMDISMCKDWREYNKCVWVVGALWHWFPYTRLFDALYNFFYDLLANWPLHLINAALGAACPQYITFQRADCHTLGIKNDQACDTAIADILGESPTTTLVCTSLDAFMTVSMWENIGENLEEMFDFASLFDTQESFCEIDEVEEIIDLIKDEQD